MTQEPLSDSLAILPKGDTASNWKSTDDSKLIEACLAGNDQAWAALIERYSRLIYAIPIRFGFSQMVADEIFQETCLILLEKLNTLHNRHRLNSWLMTVCRRICIHRLKQQKEITQSFNSLEVRDHTLPLENELIELEQQYIVRIALANLPARCQELINNLFFVTPSPSYEDIAQKLNISVGSVGPTRLRCLRKLHQELIKVEQQ